MQRLPDPIPPEVGELFDYLMKYASTGDLGVISVFDRATRKTRFGLFGRHFRGDGDFALVPLGFLSNTAGDEIIPPGLEPPAEYYLLPERYEEFLRSEQFERDRWADDGGTP